MFKLFKKIFGKKEDFFNRNGIIVKHAFTINGIEYFEVADVFNLPYTRGMAAIRIYEEVRMKCDYEYLKAYTTAISNIFTESKKIGFEEISKIKSLNDRLKERLYNIVDTDLIYKLASVVFVDKNESLIDYDWNYARKKIELWKKHSSITDFFLREPLQRLVPFLKSQEVNFETYSQAIMEFNKIEWTTLWELLSPTQREAFSGVKDFFVKETQQESAN